MSQVSASARSLTRSRFSENRKINGYPGKTPRAKEALERAVEIVDGLGHWVDIDYVYAKCQTAPEVAARHMAWRILKRTHGLSHRQISRETGGFHRRTISLGIRNSEARFPEVQL